LLSLSSNIYAQNNPDPPITVKTEEGNVLIYKDKLIAVDTEEYKSTDCSYASSSITVNRCNKWEYNANAILTTVNRLKEGEELGNISQYVNCTGTEPIMVSNGTDTKLVGPNQSIASITPCKWKCITGGREVSNPSECGTNSSENYVSTAAACQYGGTGTPSQWKCNRSGRIVNSINGCNTTAEEFSLASTSSTNICFPYTLIRSYSDPVYEYYDCGCNSFNAPVSKCFSGRMVDDHCSTEVCPCSGGCCACTWRKWKCCASEKCKRVSYYNYTVTCRDTTTTEVQWTCKDPRSSPSKWIYNIPVENKWDLKMKFMKDIISDPNLLAY
jgi:hypothetical protein